MKVKTVVVSRYPMFKAGLKRVLGPGFCITSFFDNIANLLTSNIDADLIVLDDKALKDLGACLNIAISFKQKKVFHKVCVLNFDY